MDHFKQFSWNLWIKTFLVGIFVFEQGNHKVSVYTQVQQIAYILLQKLYTIFLHLDSILALNP